MGQGEAEAVQVTSHKLLQAKLMRRIMELPESSKNEQAPRMNMTWWQLATRLMKEKHVSKVKALLRRAEEVGLVRKRTGVMPHAG